MNGLHRIPRYLARFGGATALSLVFATYAQGQARFQGLGFLPGFGASEASDVSVDGSVVAGSDGTTVQPSRNQGFRWTEQNGPQPLGYLPGGGSYSRPTAISADGSVIAGLALSYATGEAANEAFRWDATEGMVGLGDFPGGAFNSSSIDISSDGLVIVGYGESARGREAFRWTNPTGIVGLGELSGGDYWSIARGTNQDGSVVVGWSKSKFGDEAFRWTDSTGMVGLGDLPGGQFVSGASAVSADGKVVVGKSLSGLGWEAFRWTEESGMIGLGDIPGGDVDSEAFAVSADGSIVVGSGRNGDPPNVLPYGYEAFIWDADHGMRAIKEVLEVDFGLNLSGWRLLGAQGISADGRTIVGVGRNPAGQQEAWIAIIPEPSAIALVGYGLVWIVYIARARRSKVTG